MSEIAPTHAPSGLSCCGQLHWGAHFCHLYETRDDLIDTLVPYFAVGLGNNEQCLWITSEPLDANDAKAALAQRVPDLDDYLARGQITIVDHAEWHVRTGAQDTDSLLRAWLGAEEAALAKGYTGLRASGNVTFLRSREAWVEFERFEALVTQAFAGRRLLGLCSYQLGTINGADVLDVVRNHEFALARRDGEWEIIESAALKVAKQELHDANVELEARVALRTAELRAVLSTLESQKRELEEALRLRTESQQQLEAELADARLLHDISATLIDEDVVQGLYDRLVEAAAQIMRSDFASMQRLHPERNELELLGHSGFSADAADHWHWISATSETTCGAALRERSRIVATDLDRSPYVGPEERLVFRSAGIRSCQTTPLVSRNGTLLGMISTHWKEAHEPSARDLRLIDILARQAADLVERTAAAEALRAHTLQLVDADRRKDEFLATLAHELRNPLAPIQNGLAVLKAGRPELTSRVLPMMERQLMHMVRLIDDLLDVSRVSRGVVVLKRERVKLQTVIDSAFETSRPLLEAAAHRLNISVPGQQIWLDADVTRVAQVLSNVLNNAAKYTPHGGNIDLLAERVANDVVISITDTGIGIPANMLSGIFDIFAQVEHAIDRSQGGLGLGLSLARRLVDMHGGSIEARSEGPGRGSTFVIRLPVAEAPPAVAAIEPESARAAIAPRMRVLVVDDNVDAAESLGLLLEGTGYEVRIVTEATEALDIALGFRPEVIFLDLGMPRLNGFELAERIRAQRHLQAVDLVAVSGWGAEEDRARSSAAGIAHHLTKPVQPDDIHALLTRLAVSSRHDGYDGLNGHNGHDGRYGPLA
ncbi:MEDS domain-containing protein [Paraburkholderia phosphatilytica]|uniref:MEDS domain-containing protein n=1 Tax=Paraburkholderia phosphatilytica TaxID=2282883 RepID=UPI0013DF6800|nr:MEDS domain-containing protein [Paraburkholderia phosphatilytica]